MSSLFPPETMLPNLFYIIAHEHEKQYFCCTLSKLEEIGGHVYIGHSTKFIMKLLTNYSILKSKIEGYLTYILMNLCKAFK